jgi:low temperature requirement protein LtrA
MDDTRPGASLMRARSPHGHHRVTYVELFFDLVFVFAITQISHTLLEHFTPVGVAETLIMLLAVWWAWIYTSWTTNWLDPERTPLRLMMFALMLAGLILSTSIPKAFESRGLAFGLAVAGIQVGRTIFVVWWMRGEGDALFRSFVRILIWLTMAGAFWAAGGLAPSGWRMALWCVALLIDYVGPAVRYWVPGLRASSVSDWNIEGGHMAERCGLFVIIALGESILVTGATFAKLDWTTATVAAFVVAFVGSLAMWWIYFDKGAEFGSAAISHAEDPGRLGRLAYTYFHLPIVAGIIVAAVADELVLAHPGGHTDAKTAISIIGGPLLFLIGSILFKHAIRGWLQLSHLVGIGALILASPLALVLPPLGFYGVATLILLIVAVWETVSLRPQTGD